MFGSPRVPIQVLFRFLLTVLFSDSFKGCLGGASFGFLLGCASLKGCRI